MRTVSKLIVNIINRIAAIKKNRFISASSIALCIFILFYTYLPGSFVFVFYILALLSVSTLAWFDNIDINRRRMLAICAFISILLSFILFSIYVYFYIANLLSTTVVVILAAPSAVVMSK